MEIKTLSALCVLTPAMAFSAADEFQYRSGKRIAVDDKSGEVNIRIDKTTSKPTLSISAGNENGISHNYFTEFNVGKRGLDIDNTRSAKVIINEVTGNNRSSLRGNISVLHNPASLIIANPNGITCDDCSATNINGITFVTGNVSVSPETGKITGYNTIRNRIMFKNIKPGAFKNSLFSVSRALDITDSVIDAKTLNITTGVKDLEFRNNIQTQINKQKTVRSKEESKSQKKYFLDINEDSSIKSALTINAKNTNVMNNGTIRNKNSTLNLLFSELINDKEINSNHLNMNIKSSSVSNSYTGVINANKMTGQYSGDFSLNNNYGTINADTFSVKSRNINDLIDINNPETHYFFRLNKLEVINEGNINIKNIDIDAHHDRAVVLNYALLNGKNMTISGGDISLESSIRVKNAGKIEGVIGVTDKIHLNAIYAADHNLHDYSHVHASSVIR